MVRVLLIISQRNFNDEEFSITKSTFQQNKFEVTVASITKEQATGMKGLKVNPDKTVVEALKESYDAIIVIGGSGSPSLSDYPEVIEILKMNNNKGKIIAAICLAPIVLAKADLLRDVISTVYPVDWAIATITSSGAHYFKKNVVEDGNIITADGPKSAREFAEAILKKLKQQII